MVHLLTAIEVLLGSGVLFTLLTLGLARLAVRRYGLQRPISEFRLVETEDGFRLALTRYRARGDCQGLPVLLCHGLAVNAFSLDLTEERSLARHLRNLGRDVWMIELRGTGSSWVFGKWRQRIWNVDSYVTQDAPAAVRKVLEVTGAPAVHWVGHSLGGLVGLGLLQTPAARLVASLTTVGSGARGGQPGRLGPLLRRLERRGRPLHQIVACKAAAALGGRVAGRFSGVLFNPDNLDPLTWRRVLVNAVADIPVGVAAQLARWGAGTEMPGSEAGGTAYDFGPGLQRITCPVLLIASSTDRIAPPPSAMALFDHIGTPRKRFVLISKETGSRCDYGHGDLILGDQARDDVFPHITDWIEANDPEAGR